MNDRPTIKDVARVAGVSMATVHLALNEKPGVSEETRARVRKTALEIGYQPNAAAAGLRRKRITIAVILPVKTSLNRFFFSYMWDGIRDYFDSMRDYNINLVSVPYYDSYYVSDHVLDTVFEKNRPDGLICNSFLNAAALAAVKRYTQASIPVVLLGADVPESGRMCSVTSPYEIIGAMMAEQLTMQTRSEKGKYLIGVGNTQPPSHYRVVNGFIQYMEENGLADCVVRVGTQEYAGNRKESFLYQFGKEKVIGCCAVSARDSVALGEALSLSELGGKIPAIGSDVFKENIEFLRKGIFTNLIQKNPYDMAYTAAQILTDFILMNKKPIRDTVNTDMEMVFRSSLSLYDNGFYRVLG